MHVPSRHIPPSHSAMLSTIRANPLGSLITSFNNDLVADHIPMILSNEGTLLQGHVSLANPITNNSAKGGNALIIFHGTNSYISPSWCETKKHDGKIVPTWNYVVVHVYGTLKFVHDRDWLIKHLDELTNQNEAAVSQSWKVTDAPQDYLDNLSKQIVGIELEIGRIIGKWKTTVVHPKENSGGIVNALIDIGNSNASEMAILVQQRAEKNANK